MTSNKFFIIFVLVLSLIAGFLLVQKKQSANEFAGKDLPSEFEEKSDDGLGAITVSAKPSFEALDKERDLVIDLALNTHSVDMTDYDVLKNTKLIAGSDTITPDDWLEKQGSGHHRFGKLIFKNPRFKADEIKLFVMGLGNIEERVISWNM